MSFDYEKVKHILVCPESKAPLVHDKTALIGTDPETRLSYPIVDEIPRLLAVEAKQLSEADWADVMRRHNRSEQTGQPV